MIQKKTLSLRSPPRVWGELSDDEIEKLRKSWSTIDTLFLPLEIIIIFTFPPPPHHHYCIKVDKVDVPCPNLVHLDHRPVLFDYHFLRQTKGSPVFMGFIIVGVHFVLIITSIMILSDDADHHHDIIYKDMMHSNPLLRCPKIDQPDFLAMLFIDIIG